MTLCTTASDPSNVDLYGTYQVCELFTFIEKNLQQHVIHVAKLLKYSGKVKFQSALRCKSTEF